MGGRGITVQTALTTQFGLQAGPLPSMPKTFFRRVTKAAGFLSVGQAVTAITKAYHGQPLPPALRQAVNRTPGPVRGSLLQVGLTPIRPEPEEPEEVPSLITGFRAQTRRIPRQIIPGRVPGARYRPGKGRGRRGFSVIPATIRPVRPRGGEKPRTLYYKARDVLGIETDILQSQADVALQTWKPKKAPKPVAKAKPHRPYRPPTPELKKAPRPKRGTFILRRVEYPDGSTRLFKIRADKFQSEVDDFNR